MDFAFSDGTLDRADYLRHDHAALAALWPQARILVIDKDGNALCDAAQQPAMPTGAQLGGGPGLSIFLGLSTAGEKPGIAHFAVAAEVVAFDAPARIDLRSAAAQWPAFEAGVFALARALMHWHARTRFCSACGGEIEFRRAGYLGVCLRCNAEHYPRTDPAIIVTASDGERLLLGHNAAWPEKRYSCIAGFVEPGETLEQTVAREVFEETRVRIKSARYLASQPWPFPGSLMLGFEADAEPDAPQVDGELEDARWFTRAEIGAALEGRDDAPLQLPPRISIARALIERWHRSG